MEFMTDDALEAEEMRAKRLAFDRLADVLVTDQPGWASVPRAPNRMNNFLIWRCVREDRRCPSLGPACFITPISRHTAPRTAALTQAPLLLPD